MTPESEKQAEIDSPQVAECKFEHQLLGEAEMTKVPEQDLGAPVWDLDCEYPGFESEAFLSDLKNVKNMLVGLEESGTALEAHLSRDQISEHSFKESLPIALKMAHTARDAGELLLNLYVYSALSLSTDGKNQKAEKTVSSLQELFAKMAEASVPLDYYITTLNDEQTLLFLSDSVAAENAFAFRQQQSMYRGRMLDPQVEKIIASLKVEASEMWANQYNAISRTAKFVLEVDGKAEEISFSQNEKHRSSPDREFRKQAWEAAEKEWYTHREAIATGLNARTSFANKIVERRSGKRPLTVFEESCFRNRVRPETVRTLMETIGEHKDVGLRAYKLLAKAMGGDTYEPWDRLAPIPPHLSPELRTDITYAEGMEKVKAAFALLHPDAASFVDLILENNWAHASLLPDKEPGAYSWSFPRSGEPRQFINWTGSESLMSTAAHETGHSLHSWLMKDLPYQQRSYPMTLAETASNIGERLLAKLDSESAQTPKELLPVLWEDLQNGAAYLIDLPLRFEFDEIFHQRRKDGILTPDEFGELMGSLHEKWFGDIMQTPDRLFYASKQHFTNSPYYNYPYTFGYLFSLGTFSLVEEHGTDFYPNYVALLRDSGIKTCEEIASEHLGADLTKPDFWVSGIEQFSKLIDQFEEGLLA